MNRRGFLAAMLGAAAAPAIVKAEHLMKIVVPKRDIIIPDRQLFMTTFVPYEDGMVVSEAFMKKLKNNALWGAHIGDLDIKSSYFREIPRYDLDRRFATAMPLISDKHNATVPNHW